MFILDTDHISLFQRRDPHVTARVLATPVLELATTVITVEEQLRGRLDRVRRARSDAEVVRAYHNLLATFLSFRTMTIIDFDEQAQMFFQRLRAQRRRMGTLTLSLAPASMMVQTLQRNTRMQPLARRPAQRSSSITPQPPGRRSSRGHADIEQPQTAEAKRQGPEGHRDAIYHR